MGYKREKWTKQLEDKLLEEITKGQSMIELKVSMGMGHRRIKNKLLEMGFDGIKDARNVMMDL